MKARPCCGGMNAAQQKIMKAEIHKELAKTDFNGFDFDFGLDIVDESDIPDVEEKELKPYEKVHYLISLDINRNDEVIKLIKQIESIGGVEVESTLN